MNPFNVDERDLLDGTELVRQSSLPHLNTTATSNSQYFDARTISTSTAPNFTTISSSNFYPTLQSKDPAYGQHHPQSGLDAYPHGSYDFTDGAAKEERRKRNTAASARFRQKKKQKEEAMEHRMARVQSRNVELEERVNRLELENKWLKNLIVEKKGKPTTSTSDDGDDQDDEGILSSREWTANGTSVTEDDIDRSV